MLSGRAVHSLLLDVKDKYGGPSDLVDFDETMTMRRGGFDSDGYTCEISVGVRELVEDPGREYPVGEAMIPVVGLFHEVCGHGGQVTCEFRKDTYLSRVLALNYYACRGSAEYYGDDMVDVDDRYYHQPYEIAAQYVGIKCAFEYLSGVFGREDANHMLCEYVACRVENESEFIRPRRELRSVDEILDALDVEFRRRAFAHRAYDPSTPRAEGDALHAAFNPRAAATFGRDVARCGNGVKQDLMMAAAYVSRYDYDNRVRTLPVFADVSLRLGDAFHTPKPTVVPRARRRSLSLRNVEAAIAAAEAVSDPEDESEVEY